MGLTRPRAAQIFDIDYKQATRVITVANITLTGGAPAVVDGVSLVLGDRVLVTGQTTASQNGLYDVTVVGVGSDGTWARTSDGNQTGEILAGMIVMVTEGVVYHDTQWKLTTDNPIVIGTTALTFELNTSGNSISNGTSNITVLNNANVNVTVANVQIAAFASTGSYVTGLVSATGNITGNYILGNGSQLSGIITTVNANTLTGTTLSSNVVNSSLTSVGTLGSLSVTGNANVGNLGTAGLIVATGNITGGNISTSGELKSTGTFLIGTQAFYPQGSDGFSVNENFNAGNSTVTAYHYTSGTGRSAVVFDVAVTNQFTTGFGAIGTAATNKFVQYSENANTTWEWRKNVGISAPNLNGGTLIANIDPNGNLYTIGTVSSTGNITGGNLLASGLISATGNITGNYFIGNGSQLTGVIASSGAGNLWVVGRIATFYVPIISGILTIVGRSGNISVAINS